MLFYVREVGRLVVRSDRILALMWIPIHLLDDFILKQSIPCTMRPSPMCLLSLKAQLMKKNPNPN